MWKSRRAFGPWITMAVNCESSQTTLLPTGGWNTSLFSSIHCHRSLGNSGRTNHLQEQECAKYSAHATGRLLQCPQVFLELVEAHAQACEPVAFACHDIGPRFLDDTGSVEQRLSPLDF